MNQKNYEYLRDQLLYSGFGESMHAALLKAIKQGKNEFKLNFKRDDEKERISAQLSYSKSRQSDMYFFNAYQLRIVDKKSEQELKQRFYVNGSDRFTLKEAYNLLHGRAVQKDLTSKEGNRYTAWVQLDFKSMDIEGNRKLLHYHENYGFDLKKELEKFPIREMQYEDGKHYLLSSLQRGNRHEVYFALAEGDRRVAIEANPKFKSIAIYDGPMRLQFMGEQLDKPNLKNSDTLKQKRDQAQEMPVLKGKKM